jgi:hypothetical protein
LVERDAFSPELKPLVDEYVLALVGAEVARAADRGSDWDRCVKRASLLADQLALSRRGARAAGLFVGDDEDAPADGLGALDAATDELAPRRQRKSG